MQDRKKNSLIPFNTRSLVRVSPQTEGSIAPAVTVTETESTFVLTLDMPGADRSSIRVFTEGNLLKVRAGLRDTHGPGSRLLLAELDRKIYYREFTLLEGIDTRTIDAVYEEGVLRIVLQKSENARTREIPIS